MKADQKRRFLDGKPPVAGELEAEHLAPGVFMLRHAGHPYVGPISLGHAREEQQQAVEIANAYLGEVAASLPEGEQWTKSKDILTAVSSALTKSAAENGIGALSWLDVAWGTDQKAGTDPRGSFWVVRKGATGTQDASNVADRTLVLCAGFRLAGRRLGERGLRVVMHVVEQKKQQSEQGRHEARITGMSLSLPGGLTKLPLRSGGAGAQAGLNPRETFENDLALRSTQAMVWSGYDLERNSDATWEERFFVNQRLDGKEVPSQRTRALVIEITRDSHFKETGRRWITLGERASHATNIHAVFPRDPASEAPANTARRRGPAVPFGREADVDPFRLPDNRLATIPANGNLEYRVRKTNLPLFEVRESLLEGGNPNKVRKRNGSAATNASPLRSNDLAAEHAFVRGCDLFDRMTAYGFSPQAYFRSARLPLVLRHRAGIVPGARDGETVNAQVRPLGNGLSLHQAFSLEKDQRSQIEVRFGAADLSHRRVLPILAKDRKRAQHLGLAADPRWAWHEFGHVLNFASTGELELRFAHSIGDALAAVIGDPESALVGLRASGPPDRWRGVTFPWVALNRRHDREPGLGWGFDSLRFRDSLGSPVAAGERYRAYYGEQLLSSAIFRLYESIGGNSRNVATRCSAADYIVYLLMCAIQLGPASTPDQFVSALIDADVGTGVWNVATPWNRSRNAKRALRCGHCVKKVIRWAFEQQGLYGGQPPDVDIYIPDRRGDHGAPGDGGYRAVPLTWSDTEDQLWHAHESALHMDVQAGQLTVAVRNRGSMRAAGVTAAAWVKDRRATSSTWQRLSMTPATTDIVPPGGEAEVLFQASQIGGLNANTTYDVVAVASCAADRVNFDPAQWLPGASNSLRLDVIANDNNVALRILTT